MVLLPFTYRRFKAEEQHQRECQCYFHDHFKKYKQKLCLQFDFHLVFRAFLLLICLASCWTWTHSSSLDRLNKPLPSFRKLRGFQSMHLGQKLYWNSLQLYRVLFYKKSRITNLCSTFFFLSSKIIIILYPINSLLLYISI